MLAIFVLFIFSFAFMFDNLPREPVELEVNYLEPVTSELVEYGATPVFVENLRFTNNVVSYNIEESCDEARRSSMVSAFNIFSDEVKIVSFYEGNGASDIKVGCSNEFVELSDELFAAGEGGPSRIINTSGFKVIEEGRILLYNGDDCGYPIVALHELGHVFGFAHSEDPSNIMYNTSRCDQRMSEDMIGLMRDLYSIEPLADLRIDDASAVAKGKYLDFNISILNEGLRDVENLNLRILVNGDVVDDVEIGEIEIGYGRTLEIQNMKVPRSIEKVEFILDADNLIMELNEDNNAVEFVI